jgi:hypothetical protein
MSMVQPFVSQTVKFSALQPCYELATIELVLDGRYPPSKLVLATYHVAGT